VIGRKENISLYDLRTRPWDVLHDNYYILPTTTGRFKLDRLEPEKQISNPEKEFKVLGGWLQIGDILKFCFYGKLKTLD
jgi:hypothetical protein